MGTKAQNQKNFSHARFMYRNCFLNPELDDQIAAIANRAQCLLMAGEYELALADAATVLGLRPNHIKCWKRYETA